MSEQPHPLAVKEFRLEHLLEPGGRGLALAAARFHNNLSAKEALADLNRATQVMKRPDWDGGDDAA